MVETLGRRSDHGAAHRHAHLVTGGVTPLPREETTHAARTESGRPMMRTTARISLVVVSLAFLLSSAAAEAAGKRIGVAKFDGAQEALVRRKVMASLKSHGFEVVGSREMQDAISSTGASLDADDGLVTLAKELALSAIVTGEVGPKRAKVVVHDGGEGSILGDASFTGANATKLATTVGLEFWKKLGPDVGRGHVPSGAKKAKSPADEEAAAGGEGEAAGGEGEAAPKPKAETAEGEGASDEAPVKKKRRKPKMEEPPPEEAAPGAPSGLAWLDFEVGIGGLNRGLTYNQNVQINGSLLLLPYTLGLGPIAVANVVMFPLDPTLGGAIGNLGAELELQQGFAISSTLSGGQSYANTVHDYAGGVRYRFPFATSDDVYLSFTGGEDAFTFSGANRPTLPIPDTIYHYIRPGAGIHLLLGGLITVGLSGGYRVVLNAGGPQLSDPQTGLFPHLTVAGADGQLVGGYKISDLLEARVGVEWRRYWFNMHSQMNDRAIAGGMVDQSLAVTARIALTIGASSVPKSEGGGAEEPPPPPPPNPKGRGQHGGDEGGESDAGEAAPTVKTGGDDE
jgi:hypothetical protein